MVEGDDNEDSGVPSPPRQPENIPTVVGIQAVRDEEGGGNNTGAGVPLQQLENIPWGGEG